MSLLRRCYGNTILSFKNVSFEYVQQKPLIDNASFSIAAGSKITIMGQNGSGKSTILNLMQKNILPTSGNINITNGLKIAAAKQVLAMEDNSLTILQYFCKHLGTEYKAGIEAEIVKALSSVDLEAPLDRFVGTFSGGQKARLLLAAALARNPDLLLLDEPTNNLDRAGIDNLTEYILGTDKTCIVISHDEEFLNSFSDTVLYLDSFSKSVESYDGNYNDVKQDISKRIQKENQENARKQKIAMEKKEQANKFANKGGGMRSVAKKMREVADKMENELIEVRREDKSLNKFEIPAQNCTSVLLNIKAVSVPGMDMSLFNGKANEVVSIPLDHSISLRMGSKIRVTGKNGVGKTTLLENIVAGRMKGCEIQSGTRVGYYRQDFSTLNFNHTVMECLREASFNTENDGEIKRIAAQFMLTGPILNQKVSTLSEGQKGLCSFARLVLMEPGLLILDEPTNHINFRHLPAIANAINTFKGAVLFVSHDQHFVSTIKVTETLDLGEELDKFAAWFKKNGGAREQLAGGKGIASKHAQQQEEEMA